MFVIIILLSMLAMFFITISYAKLTDSKAVKTICIISAILLIFSVIGYSISTDIAFDNTTISNIEIEEIYKTGVKNASEYYVKTKDSNELLKVSIARTCKGDSNYIIRYTRTKLNNVLSFLTGEQKNLLLFSNY